jgi:septal ring factor EnvC (AmiA/AmiB activator)
MFVLSCLPCRATIGDGRRLAAKARCLRSFASVGREERNPDGLQQAYEELLRRVVVDRLAFADRVQEALDDAQRLEREIANRDAQIEQLRRSERHLQKRVDSLHAELIDAHRNYEALERSRSFRYTTPFRSLAGAVRRRRA